MSDINILPNHITITWDIQDVKEVRPDLTDQACRMVLAEVERNHNAEIGISWDTIEDAACELYPPEESKS